MKKDNISFAIIVIVAGVMLTLRKFVSQIDFMFLWPNWGFLVAGLLLLLGGVNRNGSLAMLASLMAGVCLNVLLQPRVGSVIWVSMLAFFGVGSMLSGLIEHKRPGEIQSGLKMVAISAVVFLLAGGAKWVPWSQVSDYWPVGLVLLGVYLLIRALKEKEK